MIEINPYKIYWAELTPNEGEVTKNDMRAFEDKYYSAKEKKHYKFFANKERAIKWIKEFNKKLEKQYTVLLFTDKQFGMAKTVNDELIIPFTKKQLSEVYQLK